MKSFLLNSDNKPIIPWGTILEGTHFEGVVPIGYSKAVSPGKYIVLDVDKKNNKNGFLHIPNFILEELIKSFYYFTLSGGAHYWLKYTGNKLLLNTSTKYGLDLRIGKKGTNNGGYVKYHHTVDIRECEYLIKDSSPELNIWLESLFTSK